MVKSETGTHRRVDKTIKGLSVILLRPYGDEI